MVKYNISWNIDHFLLLLLHFSFSWSSSSSFFFFIVIIIFFFSEEFEARKYFFSLLIYPQLCHVFFSQHVSRRMFAYRPSLPCFALLSFNSPFFMSSRAFILCFRIGRVNASPVLMALWRVRRRKQQRARYIVSFYLLFLFLVWLWQSHFRLV